jgi:hypothetical protein
MLVAIRDGKATALGDHLSAVKTRLKADIDFQAEQIRLRYITPGSGQAMVYQRKEQEAYRFQDTGEVGPHIAVEAARLEGTPAAIAELFIVMANTWAQMSAQIEDARLRGKDAVEAAETIAAAEAARDAIVWPG